MVTRVLMLTANPKDTSRLRLEEEVREIDHGLNRSRYRDDFKLKQEWAIRPQDIRRAMLDFHPNIVHFSGHGEGRLGIAFEDETGHKHLVSSEALAGFFKLFADRVECVILNACYSEEQAQAIALHIDYVIGMSQTIRDKAAVEFAVAFYDALGAGKTIKFAYELACNAIQLRGISEQLTPVMVTKKAQENIESGDRYILQVLANERQQKPVPSEQWMGDSNQTYDIFIRHRGENKPWVEILAHNLKDYGYHVFLDSWELTIKEGLVSRLQEALSRARKGILVVTSGGIDSGWVREEYDQMLEQQVANPDFSIIPVVLGQDVSDSPFLRNVHWMDFRDPKEYRKAFSHLLCAVENKPIEPGAYIEKELLLPPLWRKNKEQKAKHNEISFVDVLFELFYTKQAVLLFYWSAVILGRLSTS
ncbi:MAG: TIR domain-containing protein [bacterium]|nr:TIR domain-containing protein [bacterium]